MAKLIHIDGDQHDGYLIAMPAQYYILDRGILIEDEDNGQSLRLSSAATGSSIDIRGKVYGYASDGSIGIDAPDSRITIAKSGIVNGGKTIVASAAGIVDIINQGYLDAINAAIVFNATSGTTSNDGLIYGRGFAIATDGSDVATLSIENNGKISGANGISVVADDLQIHLGTKSLIAVYQDAISVVGVAPNDTVTIVNEGTISADRAFDGGVAATHFTNKGRMIGDVLFGSGDDIYVENGKLDGTIYGGNGSDTYIINASPSRIEEPTSGDFDTVKSSISYSLAKYTTGVEYLTLTGKKDIDGAGNHYYNILIGNRGNNRLDGGNGDDTLTGGKGDDVFVFNAGAKIDTITDFQQGHDRIEIAAPDIDTFNDLQIFGNDFNGGTVYITYSAQGAPLDRIVIPNADAADFDKHDFIFG